jgi:hypothetical protein
MGMMANLTMPGKEFGSRRFLQFMAHSGLDRRQALGTLLIFWDSTRAAGIATCGIATAVVYLEGTREERNQVFDALYRAGYVTDVPDAPGMVRIEGNEAALAYLESRRARARNGAAAAKKKRASKKARTKPAPALVQQNPKLATIENPTAFQLACRATWLAYAQAYEQKTCQLPIRNAKLNAQIQQIVKRLGYDDAPRVLRFYVEQVTDRIVIESLWPLDLFLRRAESYATQLKMGRVINSAEAKALSETAAYHARQRAILDGLI